MCDTFCVNYFNINRFVFVGYQHLCLSLQRFILTRNALECNFKIKSNIFFMVCISTIFFQKKSLHNFHSIFYQKNICFLGTYDMPSQHYIPQNVMLLTLVRNIGLVVTNHVSRRTVRGLGFNFHTVQCYIFIKLFRSLCASD